MERKGESYRLARHPAIGESRQCELFEIESEAEDTPTSPIPVTTTLPNLDARLRGMENEIQAIRHEQCEMRGQLFQLVEGQRQFAEYFHQFVISSYGSSSHATTASCAAAAPPPPTAVSNDQFHT